VGFQTLAPQLHRPTAAPQRVTIDHSCSTNARRAGAIISGPAEPYREKAIH
jgi:hypothetical protein